MNMQNTTKTLPNYTTARVLIYGDVMLDRYWCGQTERLSFEAPVPIVDVNVIDERPGGAGNVAVNLAALGACVDLYGVVGDDEEADRLQAILQHLKINHHFLRTNMVPTTTKLRIMSRQQQLARLDFEDYHGHIARDALQQQCIDTLKDADVLVLSDYGKGVLSDPQPLIAAATQQGVISIVDPKKNTFDSYRGATIVTPNVKEFQAVVGVCHDEDSIIDRGMLLLERYDIQALLITRGSEGMTLLQQGEAPLHLPSRAQTIYDVTGAGDTVIAMLAAGLAVGQSIAEAMFIANVAAGITVGKIGTATVQIGELQHALDDSAEYHHIIYHEQQLVSIFWEQRRLKQRVAVMAGTFDILTRQHIESLEAAKQQADCLLVVVFDEETVQQQTGVAPLHTLFARQSALTGLSAVDWVFSTSWDGFTESMMLLVPDVLWLTEGQQAALPMTVYQCLIKHSVHIERLVLDEVAAQATVLQRISEAR